MIDDADECSSAAAELGARFIKSDEFGAIPKGCAAELEDGDVRVWFNEHATGKANSNRRPICLVVDDSTEEPEEETTASEDETTETPDEGAESEAETTEGAESEGETTEGAESEGETTEGAESEGETTEGAELEVETTE